MQYQSQNHDFISISLISKNVNQNPMKIIRIYMKMCYHTYLNTMQHLHQMVEHYTLTAEKYSKVF